MRRRVTLWYSQPDTDRADAFRARWAAYLNVEREAGPLAEVIDSAREIEEGHTAACDEAKVVVVLVGGGTAEDASLMDGLTKSLRRGDAVVAVCLTPKAKVPEALYSAGCEIVNWDGPEIPQACERAVLGIRRAPGIIEAAKNAGADDEECARAPTVVVEGDPVPVPTD